jgi:hypothetical protein
VANQDARRTTEGRDIATTQPNNPADRAAVIDETFKEAIDECRHGIESGDDELALAALDEIEERAEKFAAAFPNVKVI